MKKELEMVVFEAIQLLTSHYTRLVHCIFRAYVPRRNEK